LVDEHSARWVTSAILGREGMQCKGQRRGHFSGGMDFQQVTRATPTCGLRAGHYRSCHSSDELEHMLRVRRRRGKRFAPSFYVGTEGPTS
jgi:hypothetical protein